MIGQPFVLLLVSFKLFLLTTPDAAVNFFAGIIFKQVFSLKHAHLGIVTDYLRVDGIGITFTKREVINSIE